MLHAKGVWTTSEHERFLEAIAMYPNGPWSLITDHIGTRSSKQVQTHAQKYQHKLLRHERGLLKRKTKSSRVEHRVDKATADHLKGGFTVRSTARSLAGLDAAQLPIDTSLGGLTGVSVSSPSLSATSATSSESSFPCSSPTELEGAFGYVDPLPFEWRRPGFDESEFCEPLEFLLSCGFMN